LSTTPAGLSRDRNGDPVADRIHLTIDEASGALRFSERTVHDLANTAPSSSTSADRVPRETVALDPLEEALVELARSALRSRGEVAGRRGKMTLAEGGEHGGRTT
jgi:hypothetical protein